MGVVANLKKWCALRKANDPSVADLVWHGANKVVDYYSKTYPYVFSIPWQCHNNEYWSMYSDSHVGAEALAAWCADHCQKRYRWDYLRVNLQHGIGVGGHISSDYFFDEMGGGDVLFFAFEDSQDFCFFALRWGYVAS